MHTFNAHAATDITGFGILGHAQNLARQQRTEVSFVIHNLPVLAKMAAVSKACGNMFGLMHGTCPETSGIRSDLQYTFFFSYGGKLYWVVWKSETFEENNFTHFIFLHEENLKIKCNLISKFI